MHVTTILLVVILQLINAKKRSLSHQLTA